MKKIENHWLGTVYLVMEFIVLCLIALSCNDKPKPVFHPVIMPPQFMNNNRLYLGQDFAEWRDSVTEMHEIEPITKDPYFFHTDNKLFQHGVIHEKGGQIISAMLLSNQYEATTRELETVLTIAHATYGDSLQYILEEGNGESILTYYWKLGEEDYASVRAISILRTSDLQVHGKIRDLSLSLFRASELKGLTPWTPATHRAILDSFALHIPK